MFFTLRKKKKKEDKYVHTYLVYKIKSRTKKIPAWREIETIGTALKRRWEKIHKNFKKWEGVKNSIMFIFRVLEQGEVLPNYKTANLKGNFTTLHTISDYRNVTEVKNLCRAE